MSISCYYCGRPMPFGRNCDCPGAQKKTNKDAAALRLTGAPEAPPRDATAEAIEDLCAEDLDPGEDERLFGGDQGPLEGKQPYGC